MYVYKNNSPELQNKISYIPIYIIYRISSKVAKVVRSFSFSRLTKQSPPVCFLSQISKADKVYQLAKQQQQWDGVEGFVS